LVIIAVEYAHSDAWGPVKAIISSNCRIRYPEQFVIGDASIVDDFCYFSVQMDVGRCVHIGPGVVVAGGPDMKLTLADFSGLAAGAKVFCRSDDFAHDFAGIYPPGMDDPKGHYIQGNVVFHECATIGANSVIMPDNVVPEGVAIGAMTFVPQRFKFEPWTVYSGHPIRKLMARDRKNVLAQVNKIRAHLGMPAKS
jgi:acetyltransferase-like isoleucine patch superfamily enzyme